MASQSALSQTQEERLQEILAAYLRDVEAGRNPDQAEILARHPDLAGELQGFFAGQEQLDRLAAPLRQAIEPAADGGITGTLGDFRIAREVGRGGMGIVYEAEQISLRRRVALKVLPFAAMMDPRHLQRFHNEAQAAACLHHTNIVPVFSVGSERGVHFYAMQFIDGQPLSEIIRQLGRLEKKVPSAGDVQTVAYQPTPGDADSTPLPVAEITPLTGEGRRSRDYYRKVAELGIQAAEALDHAHQLGIVHRDIKPANLLLDGRGNVWVTDFGLAHVQHGEASLTGTGQMVGTPRYMSPEQALAKRVPIDHRTDVYSLGVTLYELLTLRPAFTSEDRHELLRQIAFEEPVKPRRLERGISAELETIVLKAMEKRPQDRYATAQELADDLRRWLKDQPIRARRAGRWERLRKWIRRRPAAASLIMVSVLGVLGLLTGLLWHNAQLEEAARREHEHAEQAQRERDAAEEARRWARQAVDDMYTEVAEGWLKQQPRLQPLQRDFLEKALRFYQHDAEQDSVVSAVQQRTGMAYYRLGAIQRMLGRHKEAQEGYRKTVAIFQRLQADSPQEAEYRYQLSASYHGLGLELKDTGNLTEADQVLLQAIALCQELFVDFPDRPQFRDHLAACRITHAGLLADTGRVPEAERAYRETLDMLEKSVGRSSADPKYRNTMATAYDLLGCLLVHIGRHREAEPVIRKALAILEKLATEHPNEPEYRGRWATNLQNLGVVLTRSGRAREVQEIYRQALAIQKKLAADFPAVPDYRFDLATTQSNFGVLLRAAGQREEAMKSYELAIAGMKTLATRFPKVTLYRRHLGTFYGNLGNLLGDMGRHRDREEAYRPALVIQRRLVAEYPRIPDYRMDLALTYENLGGACQAMGRLREAEAARLQALELREKLAATFPAVPRYRKDLANCCWAIAAGLLGSPGPKSGPARRAVEFAKRAVALDDRVPRHWCVLGAAQYRAGNWGDAREALEKALRLKDQGSEAFGWFYLAMVHWQLGNKVEARAWYDKGTRRMEQGKPVPEWLQRLHDESATLLALSMPRESKVVPSGKK